MTLELGGKSPNIILPDADLDAAIKGSFQGIYFNTGQACNAGSRLFVPTKEFDEVVGKLAEMAGQATVGPGLDQGTQLGPLVSAEQEERVRGYIEKGRDEGAEIVAGGEAKKENGGGYFVEPTLMTATSDDLTVAREEIFGPVLVALPYETLDEVAARANDTEYGLAAGALDARRRPGPQARREAPRRLGVRERLGTHGRGGPLRRLQGLRHRPRARPPGPRRLPRRQDRLGQPQLARTPAPNVPHYPL